MSPARSSGNRHILEAALNYRFKNINLLEEALTHSSSVPPGSRDRSNERLEFLGDRVVGLIVARMLFEKFGNEQVGLLARRHTALVRRETLVQVAERLALAQRIRMSRGEEEAGGRHNASLLADACEAVIAAIYVDGGFEAAEEFVVSQWSDLIEAVVTPPKDAKTELQEWAQARGLPLPRYQEINRSGPAHAPTFSVEVLVEGVTPVEGLGTSKRNAEQAAATSLMARLRNGGPR